MRYWLKKHFYKIRKTCQKTHKRFYYNFNLTIPLPKQLNLKLIYFNLNMTLKSPTFLGYFKLTRYVDLIKLVPPLKKNYRWNVKNQLE